MGCRGGMRAGMNIIKSGKRRRRHHNRVKKCNEMLWLNSNKFLGWGVLTPILFEHFTWNRYGRPGRRPATTQSISLPLYTSLVVLSGDTIWTMYSVIGEPPSEAGGPAIKHKTTCSDCFKLILVLLDPFSLIMLPSGCLTPGQPWLNKTTYLK